VGKLERHALRLVHADTVLSRHTAAERQARLEQLFVHALRPIDFARRPVVEQDHRMEVAITRVKDIRDPETVTRSDGLHLTHDLWQARAWPPRALQEPVAREPPAAARRFLPSLPKQRALGLVLGDADLERGMIATDVDDARRLGLDFLARAVQLDQ